MALETPIALFIFNRPEQTAQVFEAIANQRPKKLLVISDGPRLYAPGDQDLVCEARSIIERVDWKCDVVTEYSEVNLGCRDRMASGISWAFEQAEELIILEDDCLPDPTFFGFCETLLERYRDDPRVMMISGDNFQPTLRSNDSYYFSQYAHIWGWASWRSAWQWYDASLAQWPNDKLNARLLDAFDSLDEYEHWSRAFDQQKEGLVDTWDYAWQYTLKQRKGLSILPNTNLVSNIGFGQSATHTTDPESHLANRPTHPIPVLSHPDRIVRNRLADRWTFENIFADRNPEPQLEPNWWSRISSRLFGRAA